MKHLKMLALFVMAAAALMAFAGSASAATFTAPAGTAYHGTLSSSLEGSALLKASFAEITCTTSTVAGKIEGKAEENNNETHATGPTTAVSFSNCGSSTVDTLSSSGTLTIAHGSPHTVTGTGVEVTVSALGTSCVYGLGSGTTLGAASNSASGVKLAIKANLSKISGGFLCANPAEWTANYVVTSPTGSVVD